MASESERNSSSNRAALPFEPKSARKSNGGEGSVNSKTEGKEKKKKSENSKKKAKKAEGNSSQAKISDKAQARVDAIFVLISRFVSPQTDNLPEALFHTLSGRTVKRSCTLSLT